MPGTVDNRYILLLLFDENLTNFVVSLLRLFEIESQSGRELCLKNERDYNTNSYNDDHDDDNRTSKRTAPISNNNVTKMK